jgi:hypothetical protein
MVVCYNPLRILCGTVPGHMGPPGNRGPSPIHNVPAKMHHAPGSAVVWLYGNTPRAGAKPRPFLPSHIHSTKFKYKYCHLFNKNYHGGERLAQPHQSSAHREVVGSTPSHAIPILNKTTNQ